METVVDISDRKDTARPEPEGTCGVFPTAQCACNPSAHGAREGELTKEARQMLRAIEGPSLPQLFASLALAAVTVSSADAQPFANRISAASSDRSLTLRPRRRWMSFACRQRWRIGRH